MKKLPQKYFFFYFYLMHLVHLEGDVQQESVERSGFCVT